MTDDRIVCRVLVGNLQGRRPVGRPRTRWTDNVRRDLREVGFSDDDWIDHARDGTASPCSPIPSMINAWCDALV
jgi:hypothetical protein